MATWYLFLMESELELHHLTVAKRITVGSHSLVHGRRSTPQNLGTHFITLSDNSSTCFFPIDLIQEKLCLNQCCDEE
jgi:hypothetical protein